MTDDVENIAIKWHTYCATDHCVQFRCVAIGQVKPTKKIIIINKREKRKQKTKTSDNLLH